jgi:hypothetical protein
LLETVGESDKATCKAFSKITSATTTACSALSEPHASWIKRECCGAALQSLPLMPDRPRSATLLISPGGVCSATHVPLILVYHQFSLPLFLLLAACSLSQQGASRGMSDFLAAAEHCPLVVVFPGSVTSAKDGSIHSTACGLRLAACDVRRVTNGRRSKRCSPRFKPEPLCIFVVCPTFRSGVRNGVGIALAWFS